MSGLLIRTFFLAIIPFLISKNLNFVPNEEFLLMKYIFSLLLWSALVVVMTSCGTINTIHFDQLKAGEVSFPEVIRRVGIINNMPIIEGGEKELAQADGLLEGDGKVAAEVLAQEIASIGYFDEVVICDSALCDLKVSLKSHQGVREEWQGAPLSKEEIDEWLEQLDVDMLFSLERIHVELKENHILLDGIVSVPVLDGAISSILRVYAPGRERPLFMLNKQDTIFWEPNSSLTFTKIVKEASEHAASILVPYLLPSWKEVSRHYFDGGGVEMRDAGVYVREHNWEEAYSLWKKVYETKKGNHKMRAAFNLALYSEIQGDFDQAKAYIEVAKELVKPESYDAIVVHGYQLKLDSLAKEYQQLRIQMSRFDDK